MKHINTEDFSKNLRAKAIDLDKKSLSITNYKNSQQEKDLTDPANCDGFGRIRHFKLGTGKNWPINPLPILPAAKALGKTPDAEIRAQVFQNSICNWRCWYCFVDFQLLSGDKKHSNFLTCDEMLDLYLNQENPPQMIDLTGGQPDLTPEWVPWMMEALTKRGLQDKIYLWSDDNLSNDYFWQYLSEDQIRMIQNYKMYARVCCFKGIDAESFSINTNASPDLFQNQFELAKRLVELNIDLYSYITLTAASNTNFETTIPKFLDAVQNIHELFPLRIVPLQVFEFTPVKPRMNDTFKDFLIGQQKAIEVWQKELQKRFTHEQLNLPITEINIKK